MNQPLLLPTSTVFDNANLIDNIRQTCIDLHRNISEKEIQDFLQETKTYLDKDLDEKVANELYSTILSCFINFTNQSLPFFNDYLTNCKKNANYIIITASLISRITHLNPAPTLPDYQSFIHDALTEILPQIQNNPDSNLTVFGHSISPEFKIDLIVNLLLSSQKKGKLVSKFLPFVSSRDLIKTNQNLVLLFEDISNSGLIQIQPQTEDSKSELIEFIKTENIQLIPKMSETALSFVEYCAIFITSQKNEMLEKLTNETIIPFLAIIFIFIKKNRLDIKFSQIKIANLLWEGARFIGTTNSNFLNVSIDTIISNYKFFDKYSFTSFNEVLQTFGILVQHLIKNEYHGDEMILLFATFDFSNNQYFQWDVKFFFQKYGNDLFTYIFGHLNEINHYDRYKDRLHYSNQTLDLAMIDCMHITFQIIKMKSDDMLQALFFIRHFCKNRLNSECLQMIAQVEVPIIQNRIKQKKWDELLFMVQFMKKYGFIEKLQNLNKDEIPENIKDLIFGYAPNVQDNIDELIKHILNHPHPEKDDSMFKILFDKMMTDKEILQSYMGYTVAKYSNHSYSIDTFLKLYLDEFVRYPDMFMMTVNQQFYYNEQNKILIRRTDFDLASLPISEFGLSIIAKLFDVVKSKTDCFQAFYCLKNIASSFPFLFLKDPQQIFDSILPFLEKIKLIGRKHLNNERVQLFKTSFSAMSFLLSTLRSSTILDKFINWFFTKISTFSLAQIFVLILVLRSTLTDHLSLKNVSVWTLKYNVFEIMGNLLTKDVPNNSFGFDFKENIYQFLIDAYNQFLNYTKYEIVQKEEFIKLDEPLTYAFQHSFSTIPWNFKNITSFFYNKFPSLDEFMDDVQTRSTFWLSYDFTKERTVKPTDEQLNDFISKLSESHKLVASYKLPSIPKVLTVRMVRYLVMKKAYYYLNIIFKEGIPMIQETFDETSKIINDLVQIGEKYKGSNDKEDMDIESININDFLIRLYDQTTLFKSLVLQVTLQAIDESQVSIIDEVFKEITNNDRGLHIMLEVISQKFTDIYNKRLVTDSDSSFHSMLRLIDDLDKFSKVNGFRENFFNLCGNNLLDMMLSPDWRHIKTLMLEVAKLFFTINCDLPIRTTQLIGFLLLLKDQETTTAAIKLCSKFEKKQLEPVFDLINDVFDRELAKQKATSEIIEYLNMFPMIATTRKDKLLQLLEKELEEYKTANVKDDKTLTLISSLFNSLAPDRSELEETFSHDEESSSIVPKKIKELSPKFWDLFEKYHDLIIGEIQKNPSLMKEFTFLIDYPELLSFEVRSSCFRMRNNSENMTIKRPTLHVKRDKLLESSFEALQNLSANEMRHGFKVKFENESSVDKNATRNEWFTLLSKEIFDAKNGLFAYFNRGQSCQPNPLSSSRPKFHEYMKFIGQFVALSLINNVQIEAPFTTSFCRIILHRNPTFKDLEEIDPKLYKSLQSMTSEDVSSLNLTFEIDVDEFGTRKRIDLKENGSQIKVTNDNKNEFIHLRTRYELIGTIVQQIKAFLEGFDSLIPFEELVIFTPVELRLLVCGVPSIKSSEIVENTVFGEPYNRETPVVKMLFNVIAGWSSLDLARLLAFMTGCSRVADGGVAGLCEATGKKLTILPLASGKIPESKTLLNALCLPEYGSEKELEKALYLAFKECDNFD